MWRTGTSIAGAPPISTLLPLLLLLLLLLFISRQAQLPPDHVV
jgi:hypothetical protein